MTNLRLYDVFVEQLLVMNRCWTPKGTCGDDVVESSPSSATSQHLRCRNDLNSRSNMSAGVTVSDRHPSTSAGVGCMCRISSSRRIFKRVKRLYGALLVLPIQNSDINLGGYITISRATHLILQGELHT